MNRIVTHMQTRALAAILFCAPNVFAMKNFKTLPIENNPEAKDISKNIFKGPAKVACDGSIDDLVVSAVLFNNEFFVITFALKCVIWDLIAEKEIRSFGCGEGPRIGFVHAKLSNNSVASEFYSMGMPSVIKVWDLRIEGGQPLKILDEHSDNIIDLLKITDKYIASASYYDPVKVWNLETGKCVYDLLHEGDVSKLVKISDTCIASGDNNGVVKIWNLCTGKCERMLNVKTGRIGNLINMSNKIIVGYYNGDLHVWDWKTCKFLKNLTGHKDIARHSIVANDNILISCSDDGTIKAWDLKRGFWLQSISCGNEVGYIFMTIIQNIPTLVAVTGRGAIVTCPCKFEDKDLKYFYKNLHEIMPNKKKKQPFEDLGINFN